MGTIMCVLAVFVWTLTISKELNSVWAWVVAVWSIPRAEATAVSVDEGGVIRVEALSLSRVVCIFVVQLARLAIGVLLLWYGCLFLVYTVSVPDLLLNTVALEFVISIDELIFESLAPARVRHVFAMVAALTVPRTRAWRGLDVRTACTSVLVVAVLVGVVVGMLFPQTSLLLQARDALCAGDTEFVVTRDGLGVVAWSYPETVETHKINSRNFPDGQPPAMGSEALSRDSASYAESLIDTLLRQMGRAQFQDSCTQEVCYIFDPAIGPPVLDRTIPPTGTVSDPTIASQVGRLQGRAGRTAASPS
jgi:hypothetical protein